MGFLSLRWKRMIVGSPASMLPLNTELPFQLLGGPVNIFWQSNQGVLQEIELTPYRSLFDGITEGRVKVDRWRWWEDDKIQSSHRIEDKNIHSAQFKAPAWSWQSPACARGDQREHLPGEIDRFWSKDDISLIVERWCGHLSILLVAEMIVFFTKGALSPSMYMLE